MADILRYRMNSKRYLIRLLGERQMKPNTCFLVSVLTIGTMLLPVEILPGGEMPKMTNTASAITESALSVPKAHGGEGTPVDTRNPLAGTKWRLVEVQSMDDTIGTVKPKDPSFFTMCLNSDGTVDMRLDCNSASSTGGCRAFDP